MQAYHGWSFVGKHCHKHLETSVYETSAIKSSRKRWKLQTTILFETWQMTLFFNLKPWTLSTQLSTNSPRKTHRIKWHGKNTTVHWQIRGIFKKQFSEVSILPKQHILECHCVDFIRKWGFGLGLHSELVSWCFKPSQPQRTKSGLNYINYIGNEVGKRHMQL